MAGQHTLLTPPCALNINVICFQGTQHAFACGSCHLCSPLVSRLHSHLEILFAGRPQSRTPITASMVNTVNISKLVKHSNLGKHFKVCFQQAACAQGGSMQLANLHPKYTACICVPLLLAATLSSNDFVCGMPAVLRLDHSLILEHNRHFKSSQTFILGQTFQISCMTPPPPRPPPHRMPSSSGCQQQCPATPGVPWPAMQQQEQQRGRCRSRWCIRLSLLRCG